ncbi:hypothetical protein [Qipengyuania flava]|uniref:hypothetical protein n=1 Tax=Qipengyuania flava TaxID=192812 RepID=UPI0012FE7C08|nr:hypothetical protein [Qipengyuania flava]
MSDSDDFSEIECELVLNGAGGRVLMSGSVIDEFMALDSRKQAQLLSRAKLWADGVRLTREQFNGIEGRCGGANDRMLVALKTSKAMKTRLYGFVRHYRDQRTLLIVDMDTAKKQDKANPRILKRAKAAAVSLDERCGD